MLGDGVLLEVLVTGMQFGVLFGCLKVRRWLLAVLVWRCSQGVGQGAAEMSHAIWGLRRCKFWLCVVVVKPFLLGGGVH